MRLQSWSFDAFLIFSGNTCTNRCVSECSLIRIDAISGQCFFFFFIIQQINIAWYAKVFYYGVAWIYENCCRPGRKIQPFPGLIRWAMPIDTHRAKAHYDCEKSKSIAPFPIDTRCFIVFFRWKLQSFSVWFAKNFQDRESFAGSGAPE